MTYLKRKKKPLQKCLQNLLREKLFFIEVKMRLLRTIGDQMVTDGFKPMVAAGLIMVY